MAHLPKIPIVVPEAALLERMKSVLEAGTKRDHNTEEVMKLLEKTCSELTRKDICTQVCSPKYCEEYGGKEWVQVLGLQDNRWVEVMACQASFFFPLMLMSRTGNVQTIGHERPGGDKSVWQAEAVGLGHRSHPDLQSASGEVA